MKIANLDTKRALISRLRRIEGQVRGVQTMIEEERDCKEILQQLASVRSAVQSTSRMFVQEYAQNCLVDVEETDLARRQQFVKDLVDLLSRAE